MSKFSDFALPPDVIEALGGMGIETPTPIQEACIPHILAGKDVVGKAETGTGKTIGFGAPLVGRVDVQRVSVQALVLTPTRELAQQVAEVLEAMGKNRGAGVALVVGGVHAGEQILKLRSGTQIVVGTPGRVLEFARDRTIQLGYCETVVLDEADRMLDMGFIDDVSAIIDKTPPERQTLLFSATVPPEIQKLLKRYMKDPQVLSTSTGLTTVPEIEQRYVEADPHAKFKELQKLLDSRKEESVVIFCNTRRQAIDLDRMLWGHGYSASALHGDQEQDQRFKILESFRRGDVKALVATDVASRGLDVEDIRCVINFEIPNDSESYVHRIGRTGRAQKSGVAVSLVSSREWEDWQRIMTSTGFEIERMGPSRISKRGGGRRGGRDGEPGGRSGESRGRSGSGSGASSSRGRGGRGRGGEAAGGGRSAPGGGRNAPGGGRSAPGGARNAPGGGRNAPSGARNAPSGGGSAPSGGGSAPSGGGGAPGESRGGPSESRGGRGRRGGGRPQAGQPAAASSAAGQESGTEPSGFGAGLGPEVLNRPKQPPPPPRKKLDEIDDAFLRVDYFDVDHSVIERTAKTEPKPPAARSRSPSGKSGGDSGRSGGDSGRSGGDSGKSGSDSGKPGGGRRRSRGGRRRRGGGEGQAKEGQAKEGQAKEGQAREGQAKEGGRSSQEGAAQDAGGGSAGGGQGRGRRGGGGPRDGAASGGGGPRPARGAPRPEGDAGAEGAATGSGPGSDEKPRRPRRRRRRRPRNPGGEGEGGGQSGKAESRSDSAGEP